MDTPKSGSRWETGAEFIFRQLAPTTTAPTLYDLSRVEWKQLWHGKFKVADLEE